MAAEVSKETPIWDLFFADDKPEVMKKLDPFLPRDPAGIVASYVLGKENPFGAAEWKRYFGVDIVDPPKLSKSFNTWWFSRDPLVATGMLNCETHLPPVLRPAHMSLKQLGELVAEPREGFPASFFYRSEAFSKCEMDEAGPACWLVMRKEILKRNESFDIQECFIRVIRSSGAIYENKPTAVDLATVVFIRHVQTGEHYLGDENGVEKRWTYSRIEKTIQGGGYTFQIIVGGFGPDGLRVVQGNYLSLVEGIVGIRKF